MQHKHAHTELQKFYLEHENAVILAKVGNECKCNLGTFHGQLKGCIRDEQRRSGVGILLTELRVSGSSKVSY